ncbi:MAG: flagellar hook-length control protein FliK [Paracoccaceae bacterium]|jgi:flagellar hook-length control protein FliK
MPFHFPEAALSVSVPVSVRGGPGSAGVPADTDSIVQDVEDFADFSALMDDLAAQLSTQPATIPMKEIVPDNAADDRIGLVTDEPDLISHELEGSEKPQTEERPSAEGAISTSNHALLPLARALDSTMVSGRVSAGNATPSAPHAALHSWRDQVANAQANTPIQTAPILDQKGSPAVEATPKNVRLNYADTAIISGPENSEAGSKTEPNKAKSAEFEMASAVPAGIAKAAAPDVARSAHSLASQTPNRIGVSFPGPSHVDPTPILIPNGPTSQNPFEWAANTPKAPTDTVESIATKRSETAHQPIGPTIAKTPSIPTGMPISFANQAVEIDPIKAETEAEMGVARDAFAGESATSPRADRAVGIAPHVTVQMARSASHQIAVAVTQQSDGQTEIRLNPEELGRVRLALSPLENGIVLTIAAERPETADLMRRHLDGLAQEFKALGYDNVTFAFAGDDAESRTAQQQTKEDATDDSPDPSSDQANLAKLTVSATGLDLRL